MLTLALLHILLLPSHGAVFSVGNVPQILINLLERRAGVGTIVKNPNVAQPIGTSSSDAIIVGPKSNAPLSSIKNRCVVILGDPTTNPLFVSFSNSTSIFLCNLTTPSGPTVSATLGSSTGLTTPNYPTTTTSSRLIGSQSVCTNSQASITYTTPNSANASTPVVVANINVPNAVAKLSYLLFDYNVWISSSDVSWRMLVDGLQCTSSPTLGSAVSPSQFNPVLGLVIMFVVVSLICFAKRKPPNEHLLPESNSVYDPNKQWIACCGKKLCRNWFKTWYLRCRFYYLSVYIAVILFILSIVFVGVIGAIRKNNNFLNFFTALNLTCGDNKVLADYRLAALDWNDQLQWLLVFYFFQKCFAATWLVSAQTAGILFAFLFDFWLIGTTLSGTALSSWLYSFLSGSGIDGVDVAVCGISSKSTLSLNEYNMLMKFANDFNSVVSILWVMCALSFPICILAEFLTGSIVNASYFCCARKAREKKKSQDNIDNIR